MLEREISSNFVLVLPRPVEEIFPEKPEASPEFPNHEALKKDYESLVSTAFAGRL